MKRYLLFLACVVATLFVLWLLLTALGVAGAVWWGLQG